MELEDIYKGIIERTMERLHRDGAIPRVRRDVLDAIRRKWISSSDDGKFNQPVSNLDSDPSVVDRSKYMRGNVGDTIIVQAEETSDADYEDEFADEFSDGDVIHATEVGRKLAETPAVPTATPTPKPATAAKLNSERAPAPALVNVEELPDTLDDPNYDRIPEPSDCDIRIFGQTEVCESLEGPRRADARWMVTIFNGFVQIKSTGEEFVFRTASQTMPHIHEYS
jgi:hypothetical protein